MEAGSFTLLLDIFMPTTTATEGIRTRGYSLLTVKAVDDDQRIVEGIASTPEVDRQGDILEPGGMVVRRGPDGSPDVPIKFLHGKDPRVGDIGVGHLLAATATATGIPVRFQVARGSGLLGETLDYAWGAIKAGLTRGLSVGIRALETERIETGLRFLKWELLEISPVTIPANAGASITAIKSADRALRDRDHDRANGSRSLNTHPIDMTTFTRSVLAIAKTAHTSGSIDDLTRIANNRWSGLGTTITRAAVGAHTLDGGLQVPGAREFLELVRPRTIIGRITRFRRVPLISDHPIATGSATFKWLPEGMAAPVGKMGFTPASLPPRKIGGIVVVTADLDRFSDPAAENVVRNDLVDGHVEFLDRAFVSTAAAVTDESPAGILNGVVGTASSGDPVEDLEVLLDDFTTLDGVSVLVSERNLISLAVRLPGAIVGGRLAGTVPLIPSSIVGDRLIAIHAPSVMVGEDDQVNVASSGQAALVMDDAPTMDSTTPTPAELVSLFQSDSVGIRLTRFFNWAPFRDGAVRLITGVDYSGGS